MKNLIIFLTILIALSSCEPTDRVKFEEPQPISVKNKKEFGGEIQGVYKKFSNPNKTLIIHSEIITTNLTLKVKIKRAGIEIDSNVHIDIDNDSALIAYLNNVASSATVTKDSISYIHSIHDTIFSINDENILKKYKRNYFLNYKFSDSYWRVKKLKVRGDTLYFGEIFPSDTLLHYDYANIDSNISENQVKEYVLSPSKNEFKKLMRSKAFRTTEKYIKQ